MAEPIENVEEGEKIATEWGNSVANAINNLGNAVSGLQTTSLPPGSLIDYAANALSAGMVGIWLICDGSIVTRAGYPGLFAVVGTAFNTGGETALQFRLPDFRTKIAVGRHSGDATFDTVGKVGGIATPLMTQHTHTFTGAGHYHAGPWHGHRVDLYTNYTGSAHQHGFSGSTAGAGQHGHNWGDGTRFWWLDPTAWGLKPGTLDPGYGGSTMGLASWAHDGWHGHNFSGATDSGNADHRHATNGDSGGGGNGATSTDTVTGTISTDGTAPAGMVNKNYPPFVIVTKIIKV